MSEVRSYLKLFGDTTFDEVMKNARPLINILCKQNFQQKLQSTFAASTDEALSTTHIKSWEDIPSPAEGRHFPYLRQATLILKPHGPKYIGHNYKGTVQTLRNVFLRFSSLFRRFLDAFGYFVVALWSLYGYNIITY